MFDMGSQPNQGRRGVKGNTALFLEWHLQVNMAYPILVRTEVLVRTGLLVSS